MEAGAELDRLIAEKVMSTGWCQLMDENSCVDGKPRRCRCGATGFPFEHHAPYSTDIAAAWEVVEKLKKEAIVRYCDGWRASFWAMDSNPTEVEQWEWSHGDTAPHAICLAALKFLTL